MELPIKFEIVKSGWSIVYIGGGVTYYNTPIPPHKNIKFISLKIIFGLPNSADPDGMPHYATFQLGLHFLPRYPLRGFRSTTG